MQHRTVIPRLGKQSMEAPWLTHLHLNRAPRPQHRGLRGAAWSLRRGALVYGAGCLEEQAAQSGLEGSGDPLGTISLALRNAWDTTLQDPLWGQSRASAWGGGKLTAACPESESGRAESVSEHMVAENFQIWRKLKATYSRIPMNPEHKNRKKRISTTTHCKPNLLTSVIKERVLKAAKKKQRHVPKSKDKT